MKKIFAIALALVMVLSMASAFAAANLPGSCSWGTWDCTTYTAKCGSAHAEVVKFVRTNDCDPFVESDCAGVVIGEKVYFGVKVVFDADVNPQWLAHAATKLTVKSSKTTPVIADEKQLLAAVKAGDNTLDGKTDAEVAKAVSGKTFWWNGTALVEEFTKACVYQSAVADSTAVKVCANVEYEWNGVGLLGGEEVDFGKYSAFYTEKDGKKLVCVTDKSTGDKATFGIVNGVVKTIETYDVRTSAGKVYVAYAGGKFYGIDYGKVTANSTEADLYAALAADGDTCSYLPAMMQFLGLDFGTCVNADGVKAFFGWDDDDAFKACATWSKNAASIVDAECVVAIPKTGDASVLAWLF